MFLLLKTSKLKKLIILIVIRSSLFADNNYNFYEIAECVIPVSKTFKLIRHDNKYEYSFSQIEIIDNSILINKLEIRNKKNSDYNDIINSIKKSEKENWTEPIKLIKEYQHKKFTVIIRQIELLKNSETLIIYSLLGKKSTIFISGDSINIDIVNFIIDYCSAHPKKENPGTKIWG
jgi:hypothetical protein